MIIERITIFLLVVLVLLSIGAGAFFWWNGQQQTRQVLRECKNIHLAFYSQHLECYSRGTTMADGRETSGVRASIMEDVINLSGATGEIVVLGWNSEKNAPKSFCYQKDSYLVMCTNASGMDPDYQVWRGKRIIDIE